MSEIDLKNYPKTKEILKQELKIEHLRTER